MQTEIVEKKQRILRVVPKDTLGRTPELAAQMERNAPRPVRLDEATLETHAICEQEHSEYPKVLYRLALKNGKPAGDIASPGPDYPMPFDIALQLGLTDSGFKVVGKTHDSPGNVIVRLPWITRKVGNADPVNLTVDLEAARAEEAKLQKQGWVTAPHLIKGLPVPPAEQPFDPLPEELPEEVKPKTNGIRKTA